MKVTLLIILILVAGVSAQNSNPAPTNTTAAPVTTTAAPGPNCVTTATKPSPIAQTYVYKTCLVMRFAGYFTTGANQFIEIKDGQVDETGSNCESPTSTNTTTPKLAIKFPCGTLEFGMNRNNLSQVYVTQINAKLQNTTFANATDMFKSSAGHYYKCNTEQVITSAPASQTDKLYLSNFAYEAYRDTTGTDFYLVPEECALDSSQVSDLVRIGVGICLVALVALVLIAYFVGRRRWAERSSYESV